MLVQFFYYHKEVKGNPLNRMVCVPKRG